VPNSDLSRCLEVRSPLFTQLHMMVHAYSLYNSMMVIISIRLANITVHNSTALIQHCFHMKMDYHLQNSLTFNFHIRTIIHKYLKCGIS